MKTLNGSEKAHQLGFQKGRNNTPVSSLGFLLHYMFHLYMSHYMGARESCNLELPLGTHIKAPTKACFLYPEDQPSKTEYF